LMKPDNPPSPDPETEARLHDLKEARSSAKTLNSLLKNRKVFVRRSSIWQDPDVDEAATPTFPYLLKGSGSSGTPLKMYLLLLWLAGSKGGVARGPERDAHVLRLRGDHTAALDYAHIADLLLIRNFEDRASNSGVRLITSSLRKLRDERLIELHDDARSIRLLAETRDGEAYSHPPSTYIESGKNKYDRDSTHLWVELPSEFFTCGWFTALDAPAILALLVHLWHWDKTRPRSQSFNSEALAKYAPVSKSTMTRGERILTHWSVLAMTNQRYFGPKPRSRHRYLLQLDRLERDCPNDVPPTFR